ncbi:MAG: zinc ribbon domain-containing protein, partial [Acidaminococcaceae bacterium]
RLLDGKLGKKMINIGVQKMDEESCQIFVDTRKETLQVYSWKPEEGEVNAFYASFEKKIKEYAAFILCPNCTAKISSSAKFCPECGAPVK